MNVTISEALERANTIWGSGRVTVVRMRPDAGADIETVGRSAHHLDANGHATCHDECRSLEDKRCRN
jgi:hypothetical protein